MILWITTAFDFPSTTRVFMLFCCENTFTVARILLFCGEMFFSFLLWEFFYECMKISFLMWEVFSRCKNSFFFLMFLPLRDFFWCCEFFFHILSSVLRTFLLIAKIFANPFKNALVGYVACVWWWKQNIFSLRDNQMDEDRWEDNDNLEKEKD